MLAPLYLQHCPSPPQATSSLASVDSALAGATPSVPVGIPNPGTLCYCICLVQLLRACTDFVQVSQGLVTPLKATLEKVRLVNYFSVCRSVNPTSEASSCGIQG